MDWFEWKSCLLGVIVTLVTLYLLNLDDGSDTFPDDEL